MTAVKRLRLIRPPAGELGRSATGGRSVGVKLARVYHWLRGWVGGIDPLKAAVSFPEPGVTGRRRRCLVQ